MNSLYGEQIRKDIEEEKACKSGYWMLNEYGEKITDYWSIGNSKYIVKPAQDDDKENDDDKANVMPLHVGAFVLSNSKSIV